MEVAEDKVYRVLCKKGFTWRGQRTASIRTHEYNKAVMEDYTIQLYCEEYNKTIMLTPQQVATRCVKMSGPYPGVSSRTSGEYNLYSYNVD